MSLRTTAVLFAVLLAAGCSDNGGGGGSPGDDDDDGSGFENPGRIEPPANNGPNEAYADLTVDADMLSQDLCTSELNPENPYWACAVEEGCLVSGQGNRTVLRFDVGVLNLGEADLVLGDPYDRPEDFEYGACHNHLHYKDFAKYTLADGNGFELTGRKQAFCLIDLYDYGQNGDPSQGYDCSYQGISLGWGDIYDRSLDCQWVDVTGIPDGTYNLSVEVNADHKLPEAGPLPNKVSVPVTFPLPEC